MSNKDEREAKGNNLSDKMNALRAGVLGANDGIISTAGLAIGVAGATDDLTVILISGLAGMVAGALSMAGGEYVSVSAQRDTEQAAIAKEKLELETDYDGEVDELESAYEDKGLSPNLARQVAVDLMKKDPLKAHAETELNIDPDHYVNPWVAAFSSFCSFSIGALLPLLSLLALPSGSRISGTFISVLIALALTGSISAKLGNARQMRPIIRNMVVGAITMAVTYSVGYIFKI